ncbi:MAG: methyltransferase domain-containing protein [Oligoflexales bacterium]|nr:methyltransferase domain-containing protein [Oligoflexales bacterium]
MPTANCRVCGKEFFENPLLRYENMPVAAQFFPDRASLDKDKAVPLEVCQCSGCGLTQLSNDPPPYYREVIRAAAFSEEMRDFRILQFQDFIDRYSLKDKKIIEIGCGRGEYLSIMKRSGARVYGIEYSEESVSHCIKNDFNVSRCFVEDSDTKLEHSPFDAFFILNYLEHIPHIGTTLQGIANNLTENGIGLIEVPNFDMILRKKLFSEFISDHLFYFTKDTLKTALMTNGFEILESNEIWHDYIISAVIRKRGRLDISDYSRHQDKIRKEMENYMDRFGHKRVAVWGAGHQALAVIALTSLADRIKYVIDSAPFKQGKYTPATHLPIVPPETLDHDNVDAIIVMAASYSDEVFRIIRKKYGNKINVCILRDHGLEHGA